MPAIPVSRRMRSWVFLQGNLHQRLPCRVGVWGHFPEARKDHSVVPKSTRESKCLSGESPRVLLHPRLHQLRASRTIEGMHGVGTGLPAVADHFDSLNLSVRHVRIKTMKQEVPAG